MRRIPERCGQGLETKDNPVAYFIACLKKETAWKSTKHNPDSIGPVVENLVTNTNTSPEG